MEGDSNAAVAHAFLQHSNTMGRLRQSEAVAWHRRVGYASVHALLLFAVEWRLLSSARAATGSDWALFAAALAAPAAFYYLQGSNPDLILHSFALSEGQDVSSKTGDPIASTVSNANDRLLNAQDGRGNSRELEYRRERIQQIQAALLKSQRNDSDGEDSNNATDGTNSGCAEEPQDVEAGIAVISKDEPSGKHVNMDFCAECALLPPLRAHHCAFCGKCVATFDHHCLLLATCIGEKNHCRFWWFLLLQSAELALAISVAPSSFEASHSSSWAHVNGALIALLVVLWALFLFAFGLWCFHTFLALANLTTWELGHGSDALRYLRGFGDCDLPFSRGLCRNLQLFGCASTLACAGGEQSSWTPERWVVPDHVDRNSPHVCQHLWENKYYSCC